jgi:hypothetical protein
MKEDKKKIEEAIVEVILAILGILVIVLIGPFS